VQELCAMHRLDAGAIVTEWVAFTHSKKNITMGIEILEQFEREVRIIESLKNFSFLQLDICFITLSHSQLTTP